MTMKLHTSWKTILQAATLTLQAATLALSICIGASSAAAQATQPASVPSASPVPKDLQTIDMSVGQSRLIDAPWPVKRVAIGEPAIADVDVTSPRKIQVRGKAVGMTEITLWNEQGETWQARIEVRPDVSRLQSQLRQLFANDTIAVQQIDEVLTVKGQLQRSEEAVQLRQFLTAAKINYFDLTNVAGLQQVQLQVKVAEVSRRAIRMLGVNTFYGGEEWFGGVQLGSEAGPFTPMNVGVPRGQLLPGAISTGALQFQALDNIAVPPTATLFAGFPNSDLQFFLQALAENQYLRILAEPTLVARSGQEAQFLAGGEFPLPVSQLQGGQTQISIEYKEFGIRLAFTPTVLGNGRIELKVRPEVSELSDVGAVVILGTRVPSLITRRVETTLELQTGQTFAIAGLISQNDTARTSKIPTLGDLPIIGPMFRSVRYSKNETEMLVLVTASLVEPTSQELDPPVPGAFHEEPNDWELYIEGRTEGKSKVRLAPAQEERLKRLGLDQLRGPGAWASHDSAPNKLTSQTTKAAK